MTFESYHNLTKSIFLLKKSDEVSFVNLALQVYDFQRKNCQVYNSFLKLLKIHDFEPKNLNSILFLPISAFKSNEVLTRFFSNPNPLRFKSSGTGLQGHSVHQVTDPSLYLKSLQTSFQFFFENPEEYCFLALMPSFIEKNTSSLAYMADVLIRNSNHPMSGFHPLINDTLCRKINLLKEQGKKTIILGLTYLIQDLAQMGVNLGDAFVIIETGGMKGKRKEISKTEFYAEIEEKLGIKKIYSEYGMTELLSQAYSKKPGIFTTPPWMKIAIQSLDDPFQTAAPGKSGRILIIDLANINSCAFIATDDLGWILPSGEFELLGRIHGSDLRGCNLMLSDEAPCLGNQI